VSEDDNISENIDDVPIFNDNSDTIQLVNISSHDNIEDSSDVNHVDVDVDDNSDVNELVDIPYHEDISNSSVISDENISYHDLEINDSVMAVNNVLESNVNDVDNEIITTNDIHLFNIKMTNSKFNADDSEDEESEQSDSDEEDVHRERNRFMFNFFLDEMNIIEHNGMRHRENIQYDGEDEYVVDDKPKEEEEEETYDVNPGCGYSSYQDFLNDGIVNTDEPKEENTYVAPVVTSYKSYKDFLNDGIEIPVKTKTEPVYIPKNENAEMFDSILKELYG